MSAVKQIRLDQGNLLDAKGSLIQAGYATQLVKDYHRAAIKANALKIKEWDYYLVYNHEFGIALTIADNSYMGLLSASFLDFKAGTEKTVSPMVVLPMGKMGLPSSSEKGDIRFHNKAITISFQHETGGRRLQVNLKDFDKGYPLVADLFLEESMKESIVIATPFQNAPKSFYYNQKIIGMKARGSVHYQNKQYDFEPGSAFGILDWGRGVWTYDNTWYWSAANGIIDHEIFGFNLGYGFGNTQAASENMLFYKGAHKLNEVSFQIPQQADGTPDYLKKWVFTSTDGRFEAEFTPILDRLSYTSLGIIKSDQHQVFGHFNGKVILDHGQVITMKVFLGFAEKVRNKW